jgi:hypothetical protein
LHPEMTCQRNNGVESAIPPNGLVAVKQ